MLAPTRALAMVGGSVVAGVAAVAVIAGCAAAAQHGARAAGAEARRAPAPAAVAPADVARFARQAAGSAELAASGAPVAVGGTGPGGRRTVRAAAGTDPDAGRAPDAAPVSGLAASGIPSTALSAYKNAAAREAARRPGCGIGWPLLAGIGRVESNHGRFAGAVLRADGVSTPRIIGIALNGHGTALIRDTDGGRLDGDAVYDRAVGPMQFIPSTWAGWGVDANGDGMKDPFNVYDASAAAADYLCAAGRDLTTSSGQVRAILSYNYSYDYVSMVMGLEQLYARQTGLTVPVLPTSPGATPRHGRPRHHPPLPPVDPGPPGGLTQPGRPHLPVKAPPSTASTTPSTTPATSTSEPSAGSTTSTSAPPSSSSSSDPAPSCPAPSTGSSTSPPGPSSSSASADPCAPSAAAGAADGSASSSSPSAP